MNQRKNIWRDEVKKKRKWSWVILLLFLTILATTIGTTDCTAAPVTRVKKVTITTKKSSMVVGQNYTIKTSVSPSKTTNKKLKYTSSNKKVATISSSGKIKALKKGTTTIKVASTDGSKKSTKFSLKVVTGVSKIVASQNVTVAVGKTKSIAYKISPTSAANKSVSFSTSNSTLASVSSKGIVKGKKAGTVKIYVKSKDGSNKKATVYVKVATTIQKVTMLQVSANTQHMLAGDREKISVAITPTNATNKTVSYTSSNQAVATVDTKGYIKAIAPGTVAITIKAMDGSNVNTTVNYEVKNRSDVVLSSQQFIAHMGLSSQAPQNTIPAFSLAARYPAFMGVETDVYETYDGKFALMHNPTVDAMTKGTGDIRKKTLAQLQKLEFDDGTNYKMYSNVKIPRLEDYLLICKAYNVTPVIHIKSITHYQRILDILTQMDLIDTAIITANIDTLKKFRELNASVQLYWISYMTYSGIDTAKKYNFHINAQDKYITEDRVTYAHSKGLKVGVWTVNDKNSVLKFINKGVDFVTTNYRMVPKGIEKIPTIPLTTATIPVLK